MRRQECSKSEVLGWDGDRPPDGFSVAVRIDRIGVVTARCAVGLSTIDVEGGSAIAAHKRPHTMPALSIISPNRPVIKFCNPTNI